MDSFNYKNKNISLEISSTSGPLSLFRNTAFLEIVKSLKDLSEPGAGDSVPKRPRDEEEEEAKTPEKKAKRRLAFNEHELGVYRLPKSPEFQKPQLLARTTTSSTSACSSNSRNRDVDVDETDVDLSKTMVMDEDGEVIYLLPSLSPNSVEDNSVEPRASSSSTSTDDNEDDIFKPSAWSSSTSNDDNGDNIFEPSACSSSTLVDYVPNLSPVEPLSHQLVEDDLHVGNLPATVEDLPQMVFDEDDEVVYL